MKGGERWRKRGKRRIWRKNEVGKEKDKGSKGKGTRKRWKGEGRGKSVREMVGKNIGGYKNGVCSRTCPLITK